MSDEHVPFGSLIDKVMSELAQGQCVSIIGLSNSGKSYVMRQLGSPAAENAYQEGRDRPIVMMYVDCNRAVAISAQAFYEIVLRSALERLASSLSSEGYERLQTHHEKVTEAVSTFNASLAFNLALTELCEEADFDLCFLLDEFDELYAALDERALLNLRALQDRFPDQLLLVTATVRRLPQIRGTNFQDEFSEMFSPATFPLPLLSPAESTSMLDQCGVDIGSDKQCELCITLSGGHLGMLLAIAEVLADHLSDADSDVRRLVSRSPQPRAECLKLWSQLTEDERGHLESLALEAEAGVPEHMMRHLSSLGLLRDGTIFSPIFQQFIAARTRSGQVDDEGVFVDMDSGDVWVDGVRIPVLTDLEFRLLKLLYERQDKITDKYRIVVTVWGEEYLGDVDDARVEKLVSRLRSKIEPDPAEPRYLITQRGRGYKLLSVPKTIPGDQ